MVNDIDTPIGWLFGHAARSRYITHNYPILMQEANKQGDQAAAVAAGPSGSSGPVREIILGAPESPKERKLVDAKAYEELEERIRNLRAEQKKVSAGGAPAAVAAGSNETPRKHKHTTPKPPAAPPKRRARAARTRRPRGGRRAGKAVNSCFERSQEEENKFRHQYPISRIRKRRKQRGLGRLGRCKPQSRLTGKGRGRIVGGGGGGLPTLTTGGTRLNHKIATTTSNASGTGTARRATTSTASDIGEPQSRHSTARTKTPVANEFHCRSLCALARGPKGRGRTYAGRFPGACEPCVATWERR